MENTASNPAIPVGDIAFFDNYIPSLEDGEYTISATTTITGNIDTGDYFDNPITQDFVVRGPQFTLPANDIQSVYPPAGGNSTYDQYLPNIVLNTRMLPWERTFDSNDNTVPWVCLLAFAEGEININAQTGSSLIAATVSDFLAPAGDVLKPDIATDTVSSDVLSSMCNSIQISQAVFQAIVPQVAELKYLTHVRQVNIGDQAVTASEDPGWFSVITGNRLLATTASQGTRYYVHLVSLEGYYDIMTGATAWPQKASDPSQPQDIALASLYNWSFLSQAEVLDFEQLVENFVAQANGNPDNLLLRRYVTAPANPDSSQQITLDRLQGGYIPLAYNMPGGDTSFAWYRGPLTPVIPQPLPKAGQNYHYPSASSAMIYDNTSGIFDQSYAAAWNIGRSLALADSTFAQSLMKLRKRAYYLLGKLMDANTGSAAPEELRAIVKRSALRDTFKKMVANNGGAALMGTFANAQAGTAGAAERSAPKMGPSEDPVAMAKHYLSDPAIQAFLKQELEKEIAPIATWLAKLELLYNVPFDHLVPDQQMLPVESLRFFYIDKNWLSCLGDGAISVGIQSSKDIALNESLTGVIRDAVAGEVSTIRSKLLGIPAGDKNAEVIPASGILIRSAVVSGWPGLVVKAYKNGDYTNGTPVKLLRMDRLSGNVMICLFPDIPDTVMIAEPQQGLCFGIEDNDVINLRQLSAPVGQPTGNFFPAGGFTSFYRPVSGSIGNYVLNINDGADSVVQTLQQSAYLNTTIGPAQFALEMVKAPEEISFTTSAQ